MQASFFLWFYSDNKHKEPIIEKHYNVLWIWNEIFLRLVLGNAGKRLGKPIKLPVMTDDPQNRGKIACLIGLVEINDPRVDEIQNII